MGEETENRKNYRRWPQPPCGALMRYAQEPCARLAGHVGSHRSQFAIDNQNEAHRRRHRLEYVPEVRA